MADRDICPYGLVPKKGQPFEEHHLERALAELARIIDQYGEVYLPLFEKVEAELAELRRRANPLERARRIAQAIRRQAA
ncbi:hypothetical protein [Lichenihabitans psoromatis]|uniref:hypothetical protein n=1 Tax=Lichenihabitans psoromatis TaxID=2528642 RepID=UPI001FDF327D|nr:hypothetical protein [Lichenihabitans psoromatis]